MRVPRGMVAVLAAVTVFWTCSDSSGPILQLAGNGGFETGDLTGWIVDDSGDGGFTVTSDTTGFVSGVDILAPPESTYAAVTLMSGAGSHVLYQDVALPAGKRATFRAVIYLANAATDYVNAATAGLSHSTEANQQFRVDVMNPSAGVRDVGTGVLLNVYRTMPGDPLTSGYVRLNADLTTFAGQTVRIRFAEVDNQLYFHAAVDSVRVTAQ